MIISVHIPKTGGTTFRELLLQKMGPEKIYFDYSDWTPFYHPKNWIPFFFPKINEKTELIHGHFKASKYLKKYPKADLITWLRNPYEIPFSMFYYFQNNEHPKNPVYQSYLKHQESVEEFILSIKDWDYIGKYFDSVPLNRFSFVGIMEFYNESIRIFNNSYSKLQLEENPVKRNQSFKKYNIRQDVKDHLSLTCSLGISIYKEAVKSLASVSKMDQNLF